MERGADEFTLMTLRSEGQFNTVVYEEEDLYRGNTRRDVVMMSQEDADRLGLSEGDSVTVDTECGSMKVHTAIVDIRAGNLAMYYPEANVLVPRKIDFASGTPAFKSVMARLSR
jgi:anaerobic selenocysteine-containing dehydrogenase